MTQRAIATRLEDACAIEAEALFGQDARLKSLYSNGRGTWRIFHRPLMPDEAASLTTHAVYVYVLPYEYRTGVGKVNEVEYAATFQFVMPMKLLERRRGERGWHDDPLALIRWLYTGGTHPNIPGNIFDPDYPENSPRQFLSQALTKFEFPVIGAFPNQNMVVEMKVTWQTLEDSEGNRV